MKIAQILDKKCPDGDVGVEIECEGRRLPEERMDYWNVVPDGSLRNGLEYVFKKPTKASKVPAALDELHAAFTAEKSELNFSFRTSVHVHVNCLDLEYSHMLNYIYTYMLLETAMVEFCGEGRKCNRFCLRLEDADGSLDEIKKLFNYRDTDIAIRSIRRDSVRYASVNIEALNKYGSIEFRAMRGTTDKKTILTWVGALLNIRSFAQQFDQPIDIYNFLTDKGAATLFEEALGGFADDFKMPNYEDSVYRNVSLSIDLPFAKVQKMPKVEEGEEEFKYKIGGGEYTFKYLLDHFNGAIPPVHMRAILEQDQQRMMAVPPKAPAKKAVAKRVPGYNQFIFDDAFGAPAPAPDDDVMAEGGGIDDRW